MQSKIRRILFGLDENNILLMSVWPSPDKLSNVLKFRFLTDVSPKTVNETSPHSYGVSFAMWDHSVTCHPIQDCEHTLPDRLVLALPIPPKGWKAELT